MCAARVLVIRLEQPSMPSTEVAHRGARQADALGDRIQAQTAQLSRPPDAQQEPTVAPSDHPAVGDPAGEDLGVTREIVRGERERAADLALHPPMLEPRAALLSTRRVEARASIRRVRSACHPAMIWSGL